MEIGSYLRAKGWALSLLTVLPALAAGGALVLLRHPPSSYEGSVTVTVPSPYDVSASQVGLFIANFSQTATTRTVLEKVGASTGVPRADLAADRVAVSRIGQSGQLSVTYAGHDADVVQAVAKAVAIATLTQRASVVAVPEQAQETVAEDSFEAASSALTSFQNRIGRLFPETDYQAASAAVNAAQAQLAADRTKGSDPTAALQIPQLEASLPELVRRRNALVPEVRQYQVLMNALTAASAELDSAKQALLDAQASAKIQQSSDLVGDTTYTYDSGAATRLQGVLLAAGLGIGLAFAILMAPDLLRRGRHEGFGAELIESGSADSADATPARVGGESSRGDSSGGATEESVSQASNL